MISEVLTDNQTNITPKPRHVVKPGNLKKRLPNEYEVEKVLNVRKTEQGEEFFVKWKGYEEFVSLICGSFLALKIHGNRFPTSTVLVSFANFSFKGLSKKK